MPSPKSRSAFTLIELLTVIAIIAVLMGLLFPAIGAVKEAANKTKAKSDMSQIVTGVKAYFTEYGKYPLSSTEQGKDTYFNYKSGGSDTNDMLFDVLRADKIGRDSTDNENLNPRRIAFMDIAFVKDSNNPKGGIVPSDGPKTPGQYIDPWGSPYQIYVDGDYDNSLKNPYDKNAGPTTLTTGVIVWSMGKDQKGGTGTFNSGITADDVISWQ